LSGRLSARNKLLPKQAAAGRLLDSYFAGKFRLAFSPSTSDELLHVLSLRTMRQRHGWSG
jgi:hypothetical protein